MSDRKLLDGLDDEIRDHLERETQDNIDRGMTPEAAFEAARRKFGNITLAEENVRAVWIPVWFDQLQQDFRYALRMLRRSPAFSAVVIATLALTIGMNTAVFSVVNAVLLRPLSFPHPERVLWLAGKDPRTGDEHASWQDVLAWREATSLARLVGYDVFEGRLTVSGVSTPARIATVSDDFWEMAGAWPTTGHVPSAGQSEALLAREFFDRWFGGDPGMIGKAMTVNGRESIIAGVLPPGFHVDLAPPPAAAGLTPQEIDVYQSRDVRPLPKGTIMLFFVIGELKPGVSVETARSELETIHAHVEQLNPGFSRQTLRVLPLKEKLIGDARRGLVILLGAVVLVLLVGCVNIANLLLARGSARQKELAIRTAMGAGRGRMLRQLLVESLLLAIAGGAGGLLIARQGLRVMLHLIPQAVPRLTGASLDGRVLIFAAGVSAVTALLFGTVPALVLWNSNTYDALKDGARTVSASAASVRARTMLVIGELAVTIVLVCAAGLLVKSLGRLTTYPPGFAPAQTLTMTVHYDAGPIRLDSEWAVKNADLRRLEYTEEVLRRIQSVPGVTAAGMTTNGSGRTRLFVEGSSVVPLADRPVVLQSSASEGYARAIGMQLLAGRWIADNESDPAFVVNESLARRDFPDQNPLEKRIQVDGPPGATAAEGAVFAPIVGVVADLKSNTLDKAPEPEIFADYRHTAPWMMLFVVRISGPPFAVASMIRAAVAGIDQSQPLSDVKTVESVLMDSIAPRRFTLFLLGTFAGAALLLALIGVYGVVAYSVALRTHEIGVRMAIGAESWDVVRMILRQAIAFAVVGLALGIPAALALTHLMVSLLYGVAPNDPVTLAGACAVLFVTVLVACCGPALKASRIDPLIALRCD
jgi:predicted permease